MVTKQADSDLPQANRLIDELLKIKHICDFSRSGLNVRSCARIQTLLRGHKYALSSGVLLVGSSENLSVVFGN